MTDALIAAREAAAEWLSFIGSDKQADWIAGKGPHPRDWQGQDPDKHSLVQAFHSAILAAEARGAQRERERCAKTAEEYGTQQPFWCDEWQDVAEQVAAAIRALAKDQGQ